MKLLPYIKRRALRLDCMLCFSNNIPFAKAVTHIVKCNNETADKVKTFGKLHSTFVLYNVFLYIFGFIEKIDPAIELSDIFEPYVMRQIWAVYEIIYKIRNKIPMEKNEYFHVDRYIEYMLKNCINPFRCDLKIIPGFTMNDFNQVYGKRDWSFVIDDYDLEVLIHEKQNHAFYTPS